MAESKPIRHTLNGGSGLGYPGSGLDLEGASGIEATGVHDGRRLYRVEDGE